MFNLRGYQKECVDVILWDKKLDGNSVVQLPTGAGKSIVIAEVARQLNEPILIIQPSKEILEQNLDKLSHYVDRDMIGVYSASMNEKIVKHFTFATIQSIYKCPQYFSHFKFVIVDECHAIDPKKMGGMFMKFLKAIGSPKVVGFTATPYRAEKKYFDWGQPTERIEMSTKLINRLQGYFWQRIIYNIDIASLIEQGYLCKLEYNDETIIDQSEVPLNKTRSDFDLDKFETMIRPKMDEIVEKIKSIESQCKSILVFCSSISQAKSLSKITSNSSFVTGKTPKKERNKIISDFKNELVKIVFNVGVLTTGFDHPSLDCIVLVRPTRSIALYYQMIGRGVRIAEGKTVCKVVDLTSTVKSMGRIETIRLVKEGKMWELISETGSWHGREIFTYYTQEGGRKLETHNVIMSAIESVKPSEDVKIIYEE